MAAVCCFSEFSIFGARRSLDLSRLVGVALGEFVRLAAGDGSDGGAAALQLVVAGGVGFKTSRLRDVGLSVCSLELPLLLVELALGLGVDAGESGDLMLDRLVGKRVDLLAELPLFFDHQCVGGLLRSRDPRRSRLRRQGRVGVNVGHAIRALRLRLRDSGQPRRRRRALDARGLQRLIAQAGHLLGVETLVDPLAEIDCVFIRSLQRSDRVAFLLRVERASFQSSLGSLGAQLLQLLSVLAVKLNLCAARLGLCFACVGLVS